jgi:NTP pyrophosphatase (non-canonical NTP hydrolase)
MEKKYDHRGLELLEPGADVTFPEMPASRVLDYRKEVMRTCPGLENETDRLFNLGAMGLAGETGEVVDLIKKVLFHGTPLDRTKLIKELGDVRWYLEVLAAAVGVTMLEVEIENVKKLRARYPDGFSHEAANAPRRES